MLAPRSAIVEIGDETAVAARDRPRALMLAFALCLAVGSPLVGRDGPEATAPVPRESILSLPAGTSDVVLTTFPDRLANEAWPNLAYQPVAVRATHGLAVPAYVGGDSWMVTWTEGGTLYVMVSERRGLADLLHLARSLR